VAKIDPPFHHPWMRTPEVSRAMGARADFHASSGTKRANDPSSPARPGPARPRGVPATLPPSAPQAGQLSLPLAAPPEDRGARCREILLPGAVYIRGWLDLSAQRRLVALFRQWALPPAGLRHPRMPSGHLMSVQSVCLGWHWAPYAYSRTADDTDGAPVKPLPAEVADLARAAVADACGPDGAEAQTFAPDAAIVNLYGPGAHLGLHRDWEEPSEAPVVTISLGDSCVFRFAGIDRRTGPFTDVEFRSGDLIVFGGPSRRIYHGVPRVHEGTAPAGLGLPPGRVSITVRETGLEG
jgi:alkylated DNA repair protein (DNA oxidative demethylase)